MPVFTGGNKRGIRHRMVSYPPLDSPSSSLGRDSLRSRGETGERGLGSVRRFAFGTLLCPEVSLRKPPRITVRGHPVQGDGVPLRKAPLPSSVDPWSTRRHCGPHAFRRATEGSRGAKEGLGESRGGKGTIWCPCPLLSPPPDGGNAYAMSWRISPGPGGPVSPAAASRRNGGTAYPLLRV